MSSNILQINTSTLKDYDVPVTSYLFMKILMYYPGTKIDISLINILERGFVFENDVGFYLTQDGVDFIEMVESIPIDNKRVPTKAERFELADKMRGLFPEGKKTGTSKYWRGNRSDVEEKLRKFFDKYGVYEADKIVEATQKYIQSFGDSKQLMRTLEYFISKDGNSDLATILENVDSVKSDSQNDMWTTLLI